MYGKLVACWMLLAWVSCSIIAQEQTTGSQGKTNSTNLVQPETGNSGRPTQQLKYEMLPGYGSKQNIEKQAKKLDGGGRVDVKKIAWSNDGRFLNFAVGEKKKHFDLATKQPGEKKRKGETITPEIFSPQGRWDLAVGRAKQADKEPSPDKLWEAVYEKNNITLKPTGENQADVVRVTTDGTDRRRFGTGCWVYGEELYQSRAMWWSPDSTRLVFYEMDERHMQDYFLTVNNTELYTTIQAIRYPTAGKPNPKVALHVFDLETGKKTKLNFDGPDDQYLFNVKFAPDEKHLLVSRTNRRQDVLDVIAINIDDLSQRVIVTERQDTWQNNRPMMYFLADNQRFVWETEKSGWKHYELRNMDGNLINKLTDFGNYPVHQILRLDEENGWVYFSAFSDQNNPLNAHLHRVKIDGTQHTRLTRSNLNHTSFSISPDAKWFVAVSESVTTPPSTILYGANGDEAAVLAKGSVDVAEKLNLSPAELFKFTADDGKTEIYGVLHKPTNFDPKKKYPLIIDVYGGPESGGPYNVYQPANPHCEFGYLIAKVANRGTNNRGKAFESANYLKLGVVDIQDQADAVKFLRKRDYVDGNRVGIYGHSYGGYMSALAVLKYPDIFHVAVSGAPVTGWKNYDTIYTERYMRTPEENPSGYKDGSCMNYAQHLKGRLMLVHGLIDDNVHPSNTWQLVRALYKADKRFDLQVFPEDKHGIRGKDKPYRDMRWEYFYEHLKPQLSVKSAGAAAGIE